jgi:uncharacterized membrane protein
MALATRLLDAAEREDERSSREHAAALEHLAAQARLWQRTTLALIAVLLVLVAGLVGVGVSGTVPGLGELRVVHPGEAP